MAEATASMPGANDNKEEQSGNSGNYECNICLDMAKDSVVTYCGHLFWWVALMPIYLEVYTISTRIFVIPIAILAMNVWEGEDISINCYQDL